ncbi:hypothetical protein MAM1_0228c08382 [Mucor ambiguus]|uniref:Uncharacterized protein n=1 Tax=Mucor ambiguus TaxID=91626 RepID=A0A0C9LWP1_9FUNG|nr:hypothetical protein MAM1_0228c08382 [Mucor ambiguus]
MHVIKLKWWWWMLCLLILLKKIDALDLQDLGLPNQSSCAFAKNSTLYIIGATKNISITFDNDGIYVNPPHIISQQQQQSRQINTDPACTITRSGKVVLIQDSLQIIQTITPNLTATTDTNMTFSGSRAAIEKFVNGSTHLTSSTMTSFNDFILIQGGQDANRTKSQLTYILDLRYPALGVWYELQATSLTPPASTSSDTVLYATSRWILQFRTEASQQQYVTFVDCFDPYTFLWLGTITSFNTTTNSIKAIPSAATSKESDSLLIIPSLTPPIVTQESFNHSDQAEQTTFWRLDVSKWLYNNITITPIIINNIDSSKSSQQKRDGLQTSSQSYKPVSGGTVTLIAADLAVFYGGTATTTDQQENILFFNTTELKFLPLPVWLSTTDPTMQQEQTSSADGDYKLAIILGSVMGSILFIALCILFVWCCIRRKRSRERLGHADGKKQRKALFSSMSNKEVVNPGFHNSSSPNMAEASSKTHPYVLSPIKCLSPIDLFPPAASAKLTPVQQERQQEKLLSKAPKTSRFIEHFDYHSFPLVKHNHNNNNSLGNMASSSSSPQLKIATSTEAAAAAAANDGSSQNQLPRSTSSYV